MLLLTLVGNGEPIGSITLDLSGLEMSMPRSLRF